MVYAPPFVFSAIRKVLVSASSVMLMTDLCDLFLDYSKPFNLFEFTLNVNILKCLYENLSLFS